VLEVSEYRDCTWCETLKGENQRLAQAAADAKAKLGATKLRNRVSLLMSVLMMAAICGVAWFAGNWAYGRAMAPPPPEKPEQCIESAEVISSDDSMRRCSVGGRLTVERLGVADKVLVRCHCGVDIVQGGGQ
jgi:hypothetical protein